MSHRLRFSVVVSGVVLSAGLLCSAYADQDALQANTKINGPTLSFDWPAVQIGVGTYEEGPTGLTIFHFKNRASVAVDVRGGAPGTVNTDGLRNGYGSAFIDAIVFAGGSSYGEEAITAVATGLKDQGLRAGDWGSIAFVPGAIIYDLGGRRFNEIYPDKRLARAALGALRPGVFPLGAQGAGRMAMQGGYFGCFAHSGQGGAYRQVGPTKIAAFTVVNAYGAVTDRDGRLVSCHHAKSWANLTKTSELLAHLPASLKADWVAPANDQREGGATRNTTISLVVTNQKLAPWELQRLAVQVHTSMGRGIQPFSTQSDGDTLFVASTQEIENKELGSVTMATIASEVMWDAILASVPEQKAPLPSAMPPTLSGATLASYAGRYEFAAPKSISDMRFGTIGITNMAVGEGGAKVLKAMQGGPAERAGIVTGDVITHVDGDSLTGLSLDQMTLKMRGPIGSGIRLQLQRKDQPVEVVREASRALLDVRVDGSKLIIEAIGRRPLFEFEVGKPIAVVPLSDSTFYVDGRYQTQITFKKDAAGGTSGAVLNPGLWEQKGVRVE